MARSRNSDKWLLASSCLSVCLSVCPIGWTSKKFDIWEFFENLTRKFHFFISVINQPDAQNFCFKISLFHASTCFEHMCSSSGGQNCITQPLVSSHLKVCIKLVNYWDKYTETHRQQNVKMRKFQSHYDLSRIISTLQANQFTLWQYVAQFCLQWETFQTKFEAIWKKKKKCGAARQATGDNTIGRWKDALCMPGKEGKNTDTYF